MQNRSHMVWYLSSIDLLVVTTATLLSVRFQSWSSVNISFSSILESRLSAKNILLFTLFLVLWTGIHQAFGLYALDDLLPHRILLRKALLAVTSGTFFYLIFPLFSRQFELHVLAPVAVFFVTATVLSLLVRSKVWNRLIVRPHRSVVLIVGTGPIAQRLVKSIRTSQISNQHILGFVDQPFPGMSNMFDTYLLGKLSDLEEILITHQIDEVLIALPLRSCYDAIQSTIAICERIGVPVAYHFQPFSHSVGYSQIMERALEPYISRRPSCIEQSWQLKRCIDLACSTFCITLLLPVFAVLAISIKLTSQGPAIFVQERYGLNRQRFHMFKFRTMVADAEASQAALESQNEAQGPVFKIKNDPRITTLGRFLRKTSLDELPQLINVLRGDMSLVGPRPLPLRDVSRFSNAALLRRFSVKPGLTCLWQISGRSNSSFDHWIDLDLKYIDSWSLMLDAKILLLTVPAVLRGSGAM